MEMQRRPLAAVILAAVALAAPAAAQTAPPGCESEIYRAFDFWVGDWDVFDPAGEKAGENSITAEENGCLLVERWRGAAGAMVLEGEIAYRNGTVFPFKGTWTLEKDGAVIQHFQQYNPETDEWDDWFIGRYVNKTPTP